MLSSSSSRVSRGPQTLHNWQAPIRRRSAACSLSESTHHNWTDEIDRELENNKPKYVQWVVGCENVTTHVFSLSGERLSTRATVRRPFVQSSMGEQIGD